MADEIAQLKKTVEALQKQVNKVDDQEQVRRLHYIYGYYLDKCLYQEVVDLFADEPDSFVQFLGGRYDGKAGAHRLYVQRFGGGFVGGRNGPVQGFLLDHPQMQGVVDVDYGGRGDDKRPRARGRFRALMQAGVHVGEAERHPRGVVQWFEGGLYENEYVKGADGVWRIWRLRYFPFWHGDYEHGWAHKTHGFVPFPTATFPAAPLGPDAVVAADQRMLWPDTRVVPFHYPHPVTGQDVAEEAMRAPRYGEGVADAQPVLRVDID